MATTAQAALELANQVTQLESRTEYAMHMLGTIVATLGLESNRKRLLAGDKETAESLIAMADKWGEAYQKLRHEGSPGGLTVWTL